MPFYEREDKILNLLRQKNMMTIDELANQLFVSKPTLRRDLIKLEKKGIISRGHGNASLVQNAPDSKIPFTLREQEQDIAKSAIARKAVTFIKDGDTIMLDATTSAYHIVPLLTDFHNILVITSSAKTSFLLGQMSIKNICTGGQMINRSFSYIGNDALNTVSHYNADVVFFSCRGLSLDGFASDNSIEENQIRMAMMKQSAKKIIFMGILLCLSFSSLGKVGFSPHHGRIFRLILRLLGLII